LSAEQEKETNEALVNWTLHEIHDWRDILGAAAQWEGVVAWMNTMLGVPPAAKPET
jgi:hypothetical protein